MSLAHVDRSLFCKKQIKCDSEQEHLFAQKSSFIIASPPPNWVAASWEVTDDASLRRPFNALLVLTEDLKFGSSFSSSTSSSFL